MKHLLWSAAFIVTVTIPIAVAAEDGTPDVVKERKELMQVMAREMDEIANRIVAKRDLAAIGENAMRVRNAGARSLQLFPAGSDAGLTEAKRRSWCRQRKLWRTSPHLKTRERLPFNTWWCGARVASATYYSASKVDSARSWNERDRCVAARKSMVEISYLDGNEFHRHNHMQNERGREGIIVRPHGPMNAPSISLTW
jgi:cytochrome c556